LSREDVPFRPGLFVPAATVSASTSRMGRVRVGVGEAPLHGAWRTSMARRAPAVVAVVLVLLGVIAVAVRFDAASDGTVVTSWRTDGVVVDVPNAADGPGLQTGNVVITIGGQRLADGLGGLARPQLGSQVAYEIVPDGDTQLMVRMERQDPYPLLVAGWGKPGLRRRARRFGGRALRAAA
jgi:hypothetical protein